MEATSSAAADRMIQALSNWRRGLDASMVYVEYEIAKNVDIANYYAEKISELPTLANFDQEIYLWTKQNEHLWLVLYWCYCQTEIRNEQVAVERQFCRSKCDN